MTAIQGSLLALNVYGGAKGVVDSVRYGVASYQAFEMQDFWGGFSYGAMATIEAGSAALSIWGAKGTLTKPPPGSLVGVRSAAISGGGVAAFWQGVTINRPLANWVIKTAAPVAFDMYLSKVGSAYPPENHHKIPYANNTYSFNEHPLVELSGINLEKDSRNIMLLGNHKGRHAKSYLEQIRTRLNFAWRAMRNKSSPAEARSKLMKVLDEIENDIGNGTLKPYETRDV